MQGAQSDIQAATSARLARSRRKNRSTLPLMSSSPSEWVEAYNSERKARYESEPDYWPSSAMNGTASMKSNATRVSCGNYENCGSYGNCEIDAGQTGLLLRQRRISKHIWRSTLISWFSESI